MAAADLGFDQRGAEPPLKEGPGNVFNLHEMVYSEALRSRRMFRPLVDNF